LFLGSTELIGLQVSSTLTSLLAIGGAILAALGWGALAAWERTNATNTRGEVVARASKTAPHAARTAAVALWFQASSLLLGLFGYLWWTSWIFVAALFVFFAATCLHDLSVLRASARPRATIALIGVTLQGLGATAGLFFLVVVTDLGLSYDAVLWKTILFIIALAHLANARTFLRMTRRQL
jgi:hypothetical protein